MASKKKGTGKDDWIREEKLRQAELAFIVDKQRRPVEYWWDQICSDVVPLQAFMHRVRRGKWVDQRNQYWNEVQQAFLRQSKYRAVHDRVSELHEVTQLRADAIEAITPKVIDGRKIYPVRPSSLEGMIQAIVKLDQLADAKRDAVLTMIEPDLAHESTQGSQSVFSPDEMREVAKMLLAKRQAEQRSLLGGRTDAEDANENE